MNTNIKMISPITKWEAVFLISLLIVILVDAIVFPIKTRHIMLVLGRANWLEIAFRFAIDLMFMICLIFHKKSISQLIIVFLVLPNISTLFPVLFRYSSMIQWLSPLCVLFVLFKHYEKTIAWIALLFGILCLIAGFLPNVPYYNVC